MQIPIVVIALSGHEMRVRGGVLAGPDTVKGYRTRMETYFVETAKLIEADVIVRILVYDTKAVSDILNTGFTFFVIYAFASFQNYFNPLPL